MKKLLFSLMSVALAIGLIGSAFAYFTDTAPSNTNSFTAGTLSINDSLVAETPAILLANMAPGDVTDWFVVDILNNGSIKLGWLGDWQFGGNAALMNALYVAEAKMEFLTPTLIDSWLDDTTPGYEPIMVDHFITNGGPSGPYAAYLSPVGSFGLYTFNAFNDWNGMVPGSVYEHAGALKPGYRYKLSVKFGMAAGAGNEYQNLGPVTVKLVVNATQINAAALQLQGVPPASSPGIAIWMDAQIADQTEP